MEHENVVWTDTYDDDEDWHMQTAEVLHVNNVSVYYESYGDAHKNVEQT